MDENKVVEGQEQVNNNTAVPPQVVVTQAQQPAPTENRKPKKQRRTFGEWLSDNKKVILAAVGGFAGGVGASIGAGELGKRMSHRRQQNPNVVVNANNPLDPNL